MSTYDDIAGFDTSSLGLGAVALQGGQAGIDVANAAFANLSGAARYANGVALIEAAAANDATSPVRALLAFAHQLTQLDGDSSHITSVGVEIAGRIASGSVNAATAMADFSPAVSALQISRGEAESVLIAVANAGASNMQLMAGCYLGQIITRGSEGGEGGEGGGGGASGSLNTAAAVQAIHNAVVGGSLGATQAEGLLAGLMVSPFPAPGFQPMNEMRALIGSDTAARDHVVDIVIASVGIIPFDIGYSAAQTIMSLVTPSSTPDLSLAQLANHVHSAVAAGSVTAAQAVTMVERFAPSYSDAIGAANAVATEVLALVHDGFISQAAALDQLTQGSAFTAARFLVSVATVDPDGAPAAGLHLATLIDTTSSTFMVPNTMMTAQQALTFINAGVSLGGLSGASAVALLTAMAFVPGGLTADRNAMNVAADGVRGLLAGTMGGSDAAAAVVGALAPLGFTAEQGVTFLLALGASGNQQVFGANIVWVPNADLSAAASAAIAGLIHDHGLSAAAVGAALDGVFPLGADDVQLAVSTLLRAAPILANLELDGFAAIGAGLAHAANVSPGLAMGQLNDRMLGNELSTEALIGIVAGFAGGGDAADQVAAGRQLNAIVDWTSVSAADAMAELDAAVVAGALTRGQAIVLLAGTATSSLPDGLADLLAQIATYMNVDPAAGAVALSGAVSANALSMAQGLYILTEAATLGSAATGAAVTHVLLSWVDGGILTAGDLATQLLGLAQGDPTLRAVAGDNIAALIGHGALGTPDAIALIDTAVPGTLDAHTAIVVLAHMAAAGDASLLEAVQLEIASLIGGGHITLQAAIIDLQAMQSGASTALQAVLDAELALLLTDPATLAQTAGLGSPAQVQAAAVAIAALFSTDPAAAQGILDALTGRIEGGELSGGQAAELLARIYVQGGDATTPVLAAIGNLTTIHDVSASAMADAIVARATTGGLDVAEIFAVLGPLSTVDAGAANGAIAGLMTGGVIAVSALDAAVTAGHYSASNAVAVLGAVVPTASAGLRADALAEIQALVSATPALAGQALPIFMALAVSSDHALRLVGHEGIEALAAVAPGIGDAAFLQLLSYMPVPDTAFLADTQAALNELLAGGYLTAAQAVQHIADQLAPSNPSPLINAFQALNILVELSAVANARAEIFAYMGYVTAATAAAQANGNPVWGFTAQSAISALVNAAGSDAARVASTAAQIVSMGTVLTTEGVLLALSAGGRLSARDHVTLIAEVAGFMGDPAAPTLFGTYIAGRIFGLSAADQRDSLDGISGLIGDPLDHLTAVRAIQLLLAVYPGNAKAAVLAELLDIGAGATAPGGVSLAVVTAMVSGATSLTNGMDVLGALSISGAAGFATTVPLLLERALVAGDLAAPAVMSALEATISDGTLTAPQALGLLQHVLLAGFTETAATGPLQAAILGEIDALIAAHQVTVAQAAGAMAAGASGASASVILALGGEIAAFIGSHAAAATSIVASIVAVAGSGAITGAEAVALLADAAGLGDAALQVAVGSGIAALVADGLVTAAQGAVGVYNAYLSHALTLDQVVTVVTGMWASDGAAIGAELLHQVASHGFESYADLAGRLATAVAAGTLSAAQMVDGGVAVGLASTALQDGVVFLEALVSQGLMTADAAVGHLGELISPAGLSVADAMSFIAHLAADLPAAELLIGAGLAEIVTAGHLTFVEIGSGLSDALAASPAVLSFTEAATLLIGAATTAAVAGQAGTALIALVGSDMQRFSDALDAIDAAAHNGLLTPAGAIALLGGLAGAGAQSQLLAVGAEFAALIDAGLTTVDAVVNALTAEVAAGHISGSGAVFVMLQLSHDAASIAHVTASIDYLLRHESLSAGDAAANVVAAVHDATQPLAIDSATGLLINLAESHVQPPADAVDIAVITQAGAALAGLVASGDLAASTLLGDLANLPAFGAMPLLAAIEAGAGASSALGQGAHAALLAYVTGPFAQPYQDAQYVGQLIAPGGLTAAQGLPILVDIANHGGVTGQIAVGLVFGQLVADHATTMSQLHDALYVDSVSNAEAAIILAAMIDPDAATIPMAVVDAVMSSLRLPVGADSYRPSVQPVIAALVGAVLGEGPVFEANGLRLGQAMLALSAFSRFGDAGVQQDVATAVAGMMELYHATDSMLALLGRALVSDPVYGNLEGKQLAYIGDALGFSAQQLVAHIASGVAHGLTASDAVSVLAHLTAINPSTFGGLSDSSLYPNVGLAAGAAIEGLVNAGFNSSQAVDAIVHALGVSPDNLVLLLAGFAGAGTAADQLAAGRAIAYLPAFDPQVLSQIPADAVGMVALGIAGSGAPNAETLLVPLSLLSGQDLTAAMMAALAAGALSGVDGVHALVMLGVNVANLLGDAALAMRTQLHGELVDVVRGHLGAAEAIGTILTSVPATSSFADRMHAEAGGMLAALVDAGLASAADITAAVSASLAAGTNTPAATAAMLAGAALNREYTNPFPTSHELAKSLGHTLGDLIEAGSISVSDAMAGVTASQAMFRAGDIVGEITMLAAVGGHDAAGLQAAVGQVFASIYQAGLINSMEFMPAFDAMVGAPSGLTAGQATAVLFGMAEAVGFGGLYDIATEFAALVHRGATTAQQVADGMTAEISAAHLSAGNGIAFLAYLVAADTAFANVAAGEVAELIGAGSLTQQQAIDGLLAAANPLPADLAVARIIGALAGDNIVTYAHAADAIVAAQVGGHLAMAHATALLISLAETADESGMGFLGVAFGQLVEHGLDPVAVQTALSQALQNNLVTAAQASSLVAYVAGAIAGLANADDYHYGLANAGLAHAPSAVAVAAVDRAYELSGIDAHDVVSLLTWMHSSAGTDSRWAIGQELWKMSTDGGLTLEAIFEQVVAHNPIDWMQGSLIGAMAATPTDDASRQVAVGHALGEFIIDGHMSFSNALQGLGLTGLSGGQFAMLLLSVAGGGGSAVETGVGQYFGGGLAAIPVSADAVDLATVHLFDSAVAAGALSVPELVGVLAGMGMVQYPSPYAVRTSAYDLNALVSDGRITAHDAMAVIDGLAASLDPAKLVHWLANASGLAALHDAVATEIAALVAEGVLGATQALGYIAEITGTTPLDTANLLAISADTAAHLLIDVAGHGNTALQDAAGAHLATLVLNGAYLSDIAAAVTDGSLSGAGVVHVIANMLGALAADPAATVRDWAASHLDTYVSGGLTDTATVSSVLLSAAAHATTAGLTWIGAVMGGLDLSVSAIHDAIAGGSLTAEQGLRLLLGIGADGEGVDATFLAARAEIGSLIDTGRVSGVQVMADAATSSLDQAHRDALVFALVGHGSAADDAAIGAYFAAHAAVFGHQAGADDDPFFTGVLGEAGLTFAKVEAGQMTVAQAIAHIEDYGSAHDVSAYAGLYALNSLFNQYGNVAAANATNLEMINEIAVGELSAELAGRVAEGLVGAYVHDASGTHFEAADPTALTQAEAIALLNWEATRAFLPEQADLARFMFADDLWVAKQVRVDSNPMTPFSMNAVVEAARQGNAYYNTGIQDVGRSAYAYDLALVSLVERVTAPDRAPDAQDYAIALDALSTRLTNGGAEQALVAQFVVGNLSFDQVLHALDTEVAATGLGDNPADQQLMHAMSMAWLQLRARQYVAQNPGTDGAIEATQFMQQLRDPQYGHELLTGYGALLGMSSSGAGALISSLDKQAAYQEAFELIRSRTPVTTPLSDRDQAVLDALIPVGNGMAWALDKHPIGRTYVTILENPSDANAYATLGGQVAAQLATKAAVDAMFAGTPWGAAITAGKFGAQVGLYVLSMGAVQDALGEGPTLYLRGQLTMAGATASLLGDTISDLGAAGTQIAVASAPHFIDFSNAVAHGDAQGIATSIGEIALDYYKLQTGVDLRLYGTIGERFGDLIVHLFTGDTGALGDDVRALGSAYLDTIIQNPYLAAIGSRMVQYAETINGALHDINDSYRILGENVVTGLLLVGTRLDDAGNAIRDVAHKVGGFFNNLLHGLGIDGYISGATVFADANFNGVRDAGEAWTTTDASGHYVLDSHGAPLILQGGVDTATNLPFGGTMMAPAGSTVVTPLTTLIQKVAASTTGDAAAAQQLVASALGLHSSLNLNDLDTIAATRTGVTGAADAFATASNLLNTVSLLQAAGATDDPFDALAARIVSARSLDLTDSATLIAVAASAGVSASVAAAVTQLAAASNTLVDHAADTTSDPLRLLRYVTAATIAAQGDTSHDLAAAGSDPAQLAQVLADHTGANLARQIAGNRTQVGGFGDTGGGEVPLKISADGHGIELDGNGVAGNWVRLAAMDTTKHPGATLVVYSVDSHGNPIDRGDQHIGADVGLDQAALSSVGIAQDDHGGKLMLGGQSVYLAAGDQLRFALLDGNHTVDMAPSTQFTARGDGSLQATVDGVNLVAFTNNSLSSSATLADAQRETGEAFIFLKQGQAMTVELAGSSANSNTLGFVRVDMDPATGQWSVGGVAHGDTAAFQQAVRSHMDAGIWETHGGDFSGTAHWTVSGATGYYAPVLITQSGQVFVVGHDNPGGHEQIRMFGENTFGFEDLAYNQGSDFDFNDMVMKLKPSGDHIL